MSADSPRRPGGGGVVTAQHHKSGQVVSPQPVSDRSIIDSMAGIINDIVPQAYAGSAPSSENRESITWARFEYADISNPAFYPDYNEGSSIPPLLLVLGYTTGVQVWLIAASGDATEVLSWRQGQVRTLRLLPSPLTQTRRSSSSKGEPDDPYKLRRPLVAICDSAGPGAQFCNVSFLSLKTGEQVKSIKFKSAVCDVLANKRSIVVTFPERIAVFDAKTLDDVLSITTCYPSPGPNPNPVALGTRWLAYSEKKLIPSKRSSGGSEGEGVSSYTATVLYAAKSLGKGLRGLGETVASSLTGNSVTPMAQLNNSHLADNSTQPGVVTIIDLQSAKDERESDSAESGTIIAHFTAHSDAIVAMTFDQTGALLMTADKRGHDFHVFRVQPHPGGPSLAAVHHLYVLHRGDTTAKVQDMIFSSDARWAAVSTVRGTTHVFPVASYGGPVGVRTHSSSHVVNRQSRFHKSAGLSDDGARSHSPVSHAEIPLSIYPYTNPRLPPYPHPTIIHPLAQIRQPSSLNHNSAQTTPRLQQRQRLHSDDSATLPLKICACFAPPRAWLYAQRDSANKLTKRAVDSLFIMACHGNMIQYDLEPRPASGVPKEKVCDETPIELDVEAKGQWPLMRTMSSSDILPPLPSTSLLMKASTKIQNDHQLNNNESRWLSQVEIFTHAGPHRRLWMGPQFVFKTYNTPSGVATNLVEAETVEVGVASGSRPARSNPVNMPHSGNRPLVPVVIDGSGSSYEQSPRFVEAYSDALDHETPSTFNSSGAGDDVGAGGENQLREDLAEAMLETSSMPHQSTVLPMCRRSAVRSNHQNASSSSSEHRVIGQPVAKVVNPLGTVITLSVNEEDDTIMQHQLQQQQQDVDEELAALLSSSSSSSTISSAVCAQEGKNPVPQEQPESQALKERTSICAEMRPAEEPAAIDSVPDDRIKELKERRQLCAEAAVTSTCCAVDLDRVGAFKDVPSSPIVCAERGAVPDCSNVIQTSVVHALPRSKPPPPQQSEATRQSVADNLAYRLFNASQNNMQVHTSNEPIVLKAAACVSSDDDIEHVNSEELPAAIAEPALPDRPTAAHSSDDDLEHIRHSDIPANQKSSKDKFSPTPARTPEADAAASSPNEAKTKEATPERQTHRMQLKQKKQKQRNKRPISSDMVEIINMDAVIVGPETKGLVERVPTPEVIKTFEAEPIVIVGSEPREEAAVEIKESADMIEIIDIDAENNSCNFTPRPLPECQILTSTRSENSSKKKNKRQRKQREWSEPPMQIESALDTVVVEAPEEQTDLSDPTDTFNWASLTRRDSGSTEEMGKPDACIQSMHNFETKNPEANKENIPVDNQLESNIINVGIASQLEEIEHLVEVEIPINRNEQTDGKNKPLQIEQESVKNNFIPDEQKELTKTDVSHILCVNSLDDTVTVEPMDFKEPLEKNLLNYDLPLKEEEAVKPIMLTNITPIVAKKANRSKKKKRR
ncbi:breast carcinoma-amplified sequence 3 homolog [Trichogramma pretiosum]|uniref:breast carcinoma-amplified sequence 3 homolog n=1 Tax=Trichogramma pretiosum TaxID=7493 RepID=UPI0006C97374|nr:breast carcinoma-amplified sequence 3 homolog [Trichogramma pretiosum]